MPWLQERSERNLWHFVGADEYRALCGRDAHKLYPSCGFPISEYPRCCDQCLKKLGAAFTNLDQLSVPALPLVREDTETGDVRVFLDSDMDELSKNFVLGDFHVYCRPGPMLDHVAINKWLNSVEAEKRQEEERAFALKTFESLKEKWGFE